jgi:Rod binding domain-containing protein
MAVSPVLNSMGTQPVSPLTPIASAGKSGQIRKAATDFEALLLTQMLRSARESIHGEEEDSEANSSLIDLGEQQFAQVLAANGGMGIAKMIVAGLKNAH